MPGSADPASALAQDCARQIVDAFAHYNAEFRAITRRAPRRFDARDWPGSRQQRDVERVEVIRPVFYQISRAYIVGRVVGRGFVLPLVIALKNGDSGVRVDAVMLAEDDVSIVFSFSRSYFHVDLERVAE